MKSKVDISKLLKRSQFLQPPSSAKERLLGKLKDPQADSRRLVLGMRLALAACLLIIPILGLSVQVVDPSQFHAAAHGRAIGSLIMQSPLAREINNRFPEVIDFKEYLP